jgi:hypothetical protein
MASTIFCCGVFYERFARGGLGSLGIGASTNVYYQGAYLIDIEARTATIVERQSRGQVVAIPLCLTSVYDVAQFLVAALGINLQHWPAEFTMQGDRRTVVEVLQLAELEKGGKFIYRY